MKSFSHLFCTPNHTIDYTIPPLPKKKYEKIINIEFLCTKHTVEHNYISSSSALGLQLHVSALYVGHLQVVT